MGNIIVLLVLAVLVFFAARSLIRSHRAGGCGGNCGSCGGCGCGGDSCQCDMPEIDIAEPENDKKA